MAVKTFNIKKGDLQPYLYGQLVDAVGEPIDITALTVTFTMVDYATGTTKVNAAVVNKTDPTAGKFRYEWAAADVDATAQYWYQFDFGEFTLPVEQKTADVLVHD